MKKYERYGKNAGKARTVNVLIRLISLVLVAAVAFGGYKVGKPYLKDIQTMVAEKAAKLKEGKKSAEDGTKDETPQRELIGKADYYGEEGQPSASTKEPKKTKKSDKKKKTWEGMRSRDQQQSVMTSGTTLDTAQLISLMSAAQTPYSAYVLDVTNMQEYDGGYHDQMMPASALIGIPILFTLADGIDKGDFALQDRALFSYTFANGRGNIGQNQNGQQLTLEELVTEALRYSDNNALNSLMDFLTLDRINTTCQGYGFISVDMQRKLMAGSSNLENYLAAKDAVLMLNAIYQNNFKGIDREFLLNNFGIRESDRANKGMYPACSGCSRFLNLNGITETRYTEIALVENNDRVYIMAALASGVKNETSSQAVTNFASYVVNTF